MSRLKLTITAAGAVAIILVTLFRSRTSSIPTVDVLPDPQTVVPEPAKVEARRDQRILADVSVPGRPASAPQSEASPFREFSAWLQDYKRNQRAHEPAELTAASLEQGKALAMTRRSEMAKLIRADPARALELSVNFADWKILPPEIREWVEEPFSETVAFHVYPDCRNAHERSGPWQTHQIVMRGQTFPAFVYGRRKNITTKESIPVQGIVLDEEVALWESPVQRLAGEALTAASDIFPVHDLPKQSLATGAALQYREAALIGGKIYRFSAEEELSDVRSVLEEAEGTLNPKAVELVWNAAMGSSGSEFSISAARSALAAAKSNWTTTSKRVIVLRLDFTPSEGTPFTQSMLQAYLNQASDSIREMSYGKTFIIPTVAAETLILPRSKEFYGRAQADRLAEDAEAAARAAGYILSNYDLRMFSFPRTSFPFDGLANMGGSRSWINGSQSVETIIHEFGHNYGLGHAGFWQSETGNGLLGHRGPDGKPVEHEEYGDFLDLMGNSAPANKGDFSMRGKALLDWIESPESVEARADGVYRVYRFDHADARRQTGHLLAIRAVSADQEELWIGYRRKFSAPEWSNPCAYVIWAVGGNSQRLIDTTPLSRPNSPIDEDRRDGGVAVGQTYTTPSGTLQIKTLGSGGSAPYEYLDVEITHLTVPPAFSLYTAADLATPGLLGSYVNRSLRSRSSADDWTKASDIQIAGRRVDPLLRFPDNGWGSRSSLRLTHGTDSNWDNFSVQWDGWLVVRRPIRVMTISDDSSRMWIDINGDGQFANSGSEFVNNHWGAGQAATIGGVSTTVAPGLYAIRIQYEEGDGDNNFLLAGAPSVIPAPRPQIVAQPENRTATPGSSVTFTVAVTGSNLRYQWRKDGVDIPGATQATYTIGSVEASHAGAYTVLVSNAGGSTLSQPAVLSLPPPSLPPAGGAVVFNNRVPGAVDAKVLLHDGTGAAEGWTAQLYVRTDAGAFLPLFPATTFRSGAAAGYVRPVDVMVPGVPPGTTATLVMRVFDGLNFENSNRRFESPQFTLTLGGGTLPPANLIGLTGFRQATLATLHPADFNPADNSISIAELTAYGAAWQRSSTWAVGPNPIPIDYVTRAGMLWKNGETYVVDSSLGGPPLWWVNKRSGMPGAQAKRKSSTNMDRQPIIRTLPPLFVPSDVVVVLISISPVPGASAYAIQEQVPAGWKVSHVSSGGYWDAAAGQIKWGPYVENVPWELTYSVVSRATDSDVAVFMGTASIDGDSVSISGQHQARPTARLGSFQFSAGEFRLNVSGPSGADYRIEASSDLLNWASIGTAENRNGTLFFQDPVVSSPRRFYRAVLTGLNP